MLFSLHTNASRRLEMPLEEGSWWYIYPPIIRILILSFTERHYPQAQFHRLIVSMFEFLYN